MIGHRNHLDVGNILDEFFDNTYATLFGNRSMRNSFNYYKEVLRRNYCAKINREFNLTFERLRSEFIEPKCYDYNEYQKYLEEKERSDTRRNESNISEPQLYNAVDIILDFIQNFNEGNKLGKNTLVFLGEMGSGKSTLCFYILYKMGFIGSCEENNSDPDFDNIRNYGGPFIVYIDASDFVHYVSNNRGSSALTEFIGELNRSNSDDRSICDIDSFLDEYRNRSKVIIIIDGLDEVSAGSLKEILEFTHKPRNFNFGFILTSRYRMVGDFTDLKNLYKIYIMSNWNESMIRKFIGKRYPERAEDIWNKIKGIVNLQELCTNPFMLSHIISGDILDNILKLDKEVEEIYRVHIYDILITKRIRENIQKAAKLLPKDFWDKNYLGNDGLFRLILAGLLKISLFTCNNSEVFIRKEKERSPRDMNSSENGPVRIINVTLPELIYSKDNHYLFSKIINEQSVANENLEAMFLEIFKVFTLFKLVKRRGADDVYKISFMHRSIMEYLIAFAFYIAIKSGRFGEIAEYYRKQLGRPIGFGGYSAETFAFFLEFVDMEKRNRMSELKLLPFILTEDLHRREFKLPSALDLLGKDVDLNEGSAAIIWGMLVYLFGITPVKKIGVRYPFESKVGINRFIKNVGELYGREELKVFLEYVFKNADTVDFSYILPEIAGKLDTDVYRLLNDLCKSVGTGQKR